MNWSKTISATSRKLAAALGRESVSESEIPIAIDELAAQRDTAFRQLGSRDEAIEILHGELEAAKKMATDRTDVIYNRDRTIDRLLREIEDERNRYRIPRWLQPLLRRKRTT